jgi:RNA polymerase sigma factor (sigma-70 family)
MSSTRDDLDKGEPCFNLDTFQTTTFDSLVDVAAYPTGRSPQAPSPSVHTEGEIGALEARARTYIKQLVQNDADVEEIVQDVLVELQSVSTSKRALILKSVAMHTAIDFLRRERRYHRLLQSLAHRLGGNRESTASTDSSQQAIHKPQQREADRRCADRYRLLAQSRQDTNDPSLPLHQLELKRKLQRAMKHLSPDLRLTLKLKYECCLTNKEISGALKIPIGTVKSRLHYAHEYLRLLLPNHGPGT